MQVRASTAVLALCALLSALPALAHDSGVPTDTIAMRLAPGIDPADFAAARGLRYVGPIKILDRYFVFAGLNASGGRARARSWGGVEWAEEQFGRLHQKRDVRDFQVPKDPLYGYQWHLSKLDVLGAWKVGATGRGVTIAIVDDGLEFTHPDISDNYNADGSWDYNRGKAEPVPTNYDDHGTSAAGVAAARDNNHCGVGTAFRAKLSGVRLISQVVPDAVEAQGLTHRLDINDIVSCSWGPTDDGRRLEGPGPLGKLAMQQAVMKGRDGLGTIYVWAGGNGRRQRDNCNYDGYANSRYTITVGSVGQDYSQSWYSESCAALMVVTPSSHTGQPSISTTDLVGSRGTSVNDCTSSFGGTSASAPMFAGIVALMLSSTTNRLTYRDVQHIVARSAWRVQPNDGDWKKNGGGFWHNHKYGFGMINASRAVELSKAWKTVGPEVSWSSGPIIVKQAVPDAKDTGVTSMAVIPKNLKIEWVEVTLSMSAGRRGDLTIKLKAPSGIVSILQEEHDDTGKDITWTYTSCRHWGESSAGTWELIVTDSRSGNTAELNHWTLAIYGTTA